MSGVQGIDDALGRQVDTECANDFAVFVGEGHGIGCHYLAATVGIQIGVAPRGSVVQDGLLVKLALSIVMQLIGDLLGIDTVITTDGHWLKQPWTIGIVLWSKSRKTSHHVLIGCNKSFEDAGNGIGFLELMLDRP